MTPLSSEPADQLVMFDAPTAPTPRPWGPSPCGDIGPYVDRCPTPLRPGRLVVLRCNRPAGHPDTHRHTTPDGRMAWLWGRDGRPVDPLPCDERSNHG